MDATHHDQKVEDMVIVTRPQCGCGHRIFYEFNASSPGWKHFDSHLDNHHPAMLQLQLFHDKEKHEAHGT